MYIFYCKLQFLIHLIIIKTKVLLAQAYVTMADFWLPWLGPWITYSQIPQTILSFKYFGFERIRWTLFQKRVLRTKYDVKRLLHDIFHIGHGISPRLPYQARQRSWRADMGRGLIPGTIWKISCHNLFITYFTLTIFKHWLLYCRKDLWTDK